MDVPRCYDSGFEVLGDTGNLNYCRAFQLDATGDTEALTLARAAGSSSKGCSTCTGTGDATIKTGFRATVQGTYDTDDTTTPPTLTVLHVLAGDVGCIDPLYEEVNPCDGVDTSTAALSATQQLVLAHGSLMLVSWGVLLPSGVLMAHFLRHRNPTWFLLHRAVQSVGLLCALGGFIIALTQFAVFSDGYYAPAQAHGSMGVIVMVLGLLQPLNAYFRPHKQKDHPVSVNRQRWEWLHKGSGYFALALAVPTICVGTTLAGGTHTLSFQIAYGVLVGGLLVLGLVLVWDRKQGASAAVAGKTGKTAAAAEVERDSAALRSADGVGVGMSAMPAV